MKNSKLLKEVQPTTEKQQNTDKFNMDQSTATLPFFIEKAYSRVGLEAEYKRIKEMWDENRDEELPRLNKRKNKMDYADIICSARDISRCNNRNWENDTRLALEE